MTALRFDGATIRYGDRMALDGLTLEVARGQIVGLIGESGSGKSTAALAALDLLPPGTTRSGSITVDGRDLATLSAHGADRMRGGTIALVPQEPMRALNPLMRIGAQIAEAVRLHTPLSRRQTRAEVVRLLDRVGLSPDRVPPTRYPHQLSGGQRQRVCIAMAIAGSPSILIADEPTTALDVHTQAQVMQLLSDLVRERDMALLLVSHDLALVHGIADHIAVLKDGRLVEQGAATDILLRPTHPYTRHLIDRARHAPARSPVTPTGAPMLSANALEQTYDRRVRALDGVSLTLHPGETLGVIGESGSGKSTLLRLVLGLDRPDAGTVAIDGSAIVDLRGARLTAIRRQIQAVFQDPSGSFDPRQRVGTIIAEPLHLADPRPTPAEREARVATALERVGLSAADAQLYPHQFSGGQRQRIGIARALILQPRIVVLDEAVSALDMSTRADILDLLTQLQSDLDLAYLFVSHDLSVMRATTDRLIVLKDGRIVEQGPTAAVLSDPQHAYTRELIAATPDLNDMASR